MSTSLESSPQHAHITDPFLLSILSTSTAGRAQALSLYALLLTNPDALTLSSAQKQLFAYLAHLRGLNRRLAHEVRATKSQTAASRAEVDRLHLGLQNLYYEQRHLHSEITACEGYPFTYTQLPLVSEEEFFAENEDMRGATEEEVMRARIEHERQGREQLEEERLKLVRRKKELVEGNERRKVELGKLDKELERFVEVSFGVFCGGDNNGANGFAGCKTDTADLRQGVLDATSEKLVIAMSWSRERCGWEAA